MKLQEVTELLNGKVERLGIWFTGDTCISVIDAHGHFADAFKESQVVEIAVREGLIMLELAGAAKMNNCETCIYWPPSSCDGKPCSLCDTNDVYLNCYQPRNAL